MTIGEVMRVFLVSTMYPRDAADWRGVFIRNMVYALSRVPYIKLSVWAPPSELPESCRQGVLDSRNPVAQQAC